MVVDWVGIGRGCGMYGVLVADFGCFVKIRKDVTFLSKFTLLNILKMLPFCRGFLYVVGF